MRKKKTSPWLLFAGLAAVISLIFYIWPDKQRQEQLGNYQLETTGAGANVDYTGACITIHRSVDTILAKQRAITKQQLDLPRQTPRIQAEGEIKWHSRHLLVEKPKEVSIENFVKAIGSELRQTTGKIIARQSDIFQGVRSQRLDIGLQEKLDHEPITIISDKVYIITESPAQPELAQARAKMAIIIDDFGYSVEPIHLFANIKSALTFSVLPNRPYSNEAAANALSTGHQVMLHLPMEPLSVTNDREQLVVSSAMSDEQIKATIAKLLATVPGTTGINNHQGSKATTNRRVMRAVMSAIKPHNLFFIDSRTTAASVAAEVAHQAGIRTAENDLFIDNNPDIGAIKQQLRQAIKVALKQGKTIVIGHARPTTAIALQEMLPEIQASGIRLVFASELTK